jgi:hypothetical protein
LFGDFGNTGSGGAGGWDAAISSFFGGGRAGGGDTIAGPGYLLGEQGSEMFVPRTAGTVIPAERTAAAPSRARSIARGGETFVIQGATSPRAIARIQLQQGRQQRQSDREFA